MDPRIEALESAVLASLRRLGPVSALVASVSGGADSTALLVAAARLRDRTGFLLRCLHVNHGIRCESEHALDEAHVRRLCDLYAIPLRIVRIPAGRISGEAALTGAGIEAVARKYRLGAWAEECRQEAGERILVGHSAEDALETALMRFLRGSGPAGLAAMPEAREYLVRPLLSLKRAEILAYLETLGIPYRTDSTNADQSYLRNRIRALLVPLLDAEFPFWRTGVANAAGTQRKVASFLDAESSRRILWDRSGRTPSAYGTDLENFRSQPDILREEALYRAFHLAVEGEGGTGGRLVADVSRSSRAEPARGTVALFSGECADPVDFGVARAFAEEGRVVVAATCGEGGENGFSLLVDRPGTYIHGSFRLIVGTVATSECQSAIRLPFVLRSPLPEDRIITARGARRPFTHGERAVLEDGSGIAACMAADGDGRFECVLRENGAKTMDYASLTFFSILYVRGNNA